MNRLMREEEFAGSDDKTDNGLPPVLTTVDMDAPENARSKEAASRRQKKVAVLRLSIELAGKAKRLQDAERIAHGIHVNEDEAGVGHFIWELKLAQPPAREPELIEAGDGSDTDDPFDVPPAVDPGAPPGL
jgi:hypothetical protein